jgi:membrane protease YdiL (CAAX protease family)
VKEKNKLACLIMGLTIDKNFIIHIGIILLSMFLFIAFPIESGSMFQRVVVNVTFLLVIPALYITIVLKKKLSAFGVAKGNVRAGIFWGSLSLVVALLIFYLVVEYSGFSKSYLIPDLVRHKFSYFLLYQLLLVGFFSITYEFFFRGLVMLGLEKYLGDRWSMIVQFLLFLLFLAFTGGIGWQMFYFILMAALSGLVVQKSRSVYYSMAATWIFILLADAWIIKFIK